MTATTESLFVTSLIILLLVNFGVPYLTGWLTDDSQADYEGLQTSSGLSLLQSIGGFLVWSFGLYPVWLDIIMLIVRIIFYVTLYRLVLPTTG